MSNPGTPDLFTASDVARFCQVDIKTIHNWVDKGEIRHFRTPGRHLRFRRLDVLDFLRKYGYPVPPIFQQLDAPGEHGKPVTAFIVRDTSRLPEVIEKMKGTCVVRTYADVAVALIGLGESPPDALVFDLTDVVPMSVLEMVDAVTKTARLADTKCIIWSELPAKDPRIVAALNRAHALVKKGEWEMLKSAIAAIASDQPAS